MEKKAIQEAFEITLKMSVLLHSTWHDSIRDGQRVMLVHKQLFHACSESSLVYVLQKRDHRIGTLQL